MTENYTHQASFKYGQAMINVRGDTIEEFVSNLDTFQVHAIDKVMAVQDVLRDAIRQAELVQEAQAVAQRTFPGSQAVPANPAQALGWNPQATNPAVSQQQDQWPNQTPAQQVTPCSVAGCTGILQYKSGSGAGGAWVGMLCSTRTRGHAVWRTLQGGAINPEWNLAWDNQ